MRLPPQPGSNEAELMAVRMASALGKRPGDLERRYLQEQRRKGFVKAVLRGRFYGSEKRTFGHQMCCRFEFEIAKVLSVE